MPHAYFSETMQNRTLLLWAIAVRRQLDRWEPLVAEYMRAVMANETPAEQVIWDANIEHHFLLVASAHLVKAMDMFDLEVRADPVVKSDLRDVRDLLEHWDENMPVFNVTPRRSEPRYPSGKSFAERHPDRSPYWWLYWDLQRRRANVTLGVSAQGLYDLVADVQDAVLERAPGLARFVPIDWLTDD